MSSIIEILKKENIVKNYGLIITTITIFLWIISGLREVYIFSSLGVSYKLIDFGLLDTFVFLLVNFSFMVLIFILPYYVNKLDVEKYPLFFKIELLVYYIVVSLVNAMYTQQVNKGYSNFISNYPEFIILSFTIIGLVHFTTYKTTINLHSKDKTNSNIIQNKGLAVVISKKIINNIQYIHSKFLFSKIDYGLIIRFSDFLENKIIPITRKIKEYLFLLSSIIMGVLLLFTVILSLLSLNYPNGSQYDYVEINNVKSLIIGEYRGNFIVTNYYKVDELPSEMRKQYDKYGYVINTYEYRLVKIDGQKLGKVDVSNSYIEKTIKIK